jgi:hypothetical protein
MNRGLILGVALALGVALSACASKAPAPKLNPDQRYVEELRSSATGALVVQATDANLVSFGHAVCTLLDQGRTPADIAAAMITGRSFAELSSADAATSISGAVRAFCPRHAGVVQAWDGAPAPTTSSPPTTTPPPTTSPRRVKPKR